MMSDYVLDISLMGTDQICFQWQMKRGLHLQKSDLIPFTCQSPPPPYIIFFCLQLVVGIAEISGFGKRTIMVHHPQLS